MATPDQAAALNGPDWPAAGFGVYVHWPFCLAKCPYCDFNSHVTRSVDHAAWAGALAREAAWMRALTGPRQADTVFFGGGTPSLMEPATVARLIGEIDRLWGLAPGAEITLEANPTSVEAGRFRDFAAAGVNRVSMGIQALDDRDLRALGRQHSVAEAEAAFGIAQALFPRVSFDLIYARMGQTPAGWEAELTRALDMAADHLSLYQLTLEEGTRFWDLARRGRLHVPPDEIAADMYEITRDMTAARGLPGYEISNHARPGAESRHNLIYWRYGDYAGIGPGAHGRITGTVREALATERQPGAWLAAVAAEGHGLVERSVLTREEQAEEYLMMALRLAEGASIPRFERLAGRTLDSAPWQETGHLRVTGKRLVATETGRLVLNRLLGALLTAP